MVLVYNSSVSPFFDVTQDSGPGHSWSDFEEQYLTGKDGSCATPLYDDLTRPYHLAMMLLWAHNSLLLLRFLRHTHAHPGLNILSATIVFSMSLLSDFCVLFSCILLIFGGLAHSYFGGMGFSEFTSFGQSVHSVALLSFGLFDYSSLEPRIVRDFWIFYTFIWFVLLIWFIVVPNIFIAIVIDGYEKASSIIEDPQQQHYKSILSHFGQSVERILFRIFHKRAAAAAQSCLQDRPAADFAAVIQLVQAEESAAEGVTVLAEDIEGVLNSFFHVLSRQEPGVVDAVSKYALQHGRIRISPESSQTPVSELNPPGSLRADLTASIAQGNSAIASKLEVVLDQLSTTHNAGGGRHRRRAGRARTSATAEEGSQAASHQPLVSD
jgi:hypothetical protein